jgi:hypothetical protein
MQHKKFSLHLDTKYKIICFELHPVAEHINDNNKIVVCIRFYCCYPLFPCTYERTYHLFHDMKYKHYWNENKLSITKETTL